MAVITPAKHTMECGSYSASLVRPMTDECSAALAECIICTPLFVRTGKFTHRELDSALRRGCQVLTAWTARRRTASIQVWWAHR